MSDKPIVYGDSEPADAWHPDDPTPVLLENVSRRCSLLGEPPVRVNLRNDLERFNELAIRVNRLKVREELLTELEQVAVTMIVEDVAFLRRRLEVTSG